MFMHDNNIKIPDFFSLRSQATELSCQNVHVMIKKYDFYDAFINPDGKGFSHSYSSEVRDGNKIVIDEVTNLMWQQSGAI